MTTDLLVELDEAERKAIDSLARYKFMMFGYWASIWVHLNRLSEAKRANPFRPLVENARVIRLASVAVNAARPRCEVCGTTDHHVDRHGNIIENQPRG